MPHHKKRCILAHKSSNSDILDVLKKMDYFDEASISIIDIEIQRFWLF